MNFDRVRITGRNGPWTAEVAQDSYGKPIIRFDNVPNTNGPNRDVRRGRYPVYRLECRIDDIENGLITLTSDCPELASKLTFFTIVFDHDGHYWRIRIDRLDDLAFWVEITSV